MTVLGVKISLVRKGREDTCDEATGFPEQLFSVRARMRVFKDACSNSAQLRGQQVTLL